MLPLISALNITAFAATQRFTVTNKSGSAATTFAYGEPIMITPLSGSGTDWIGIAKKGEVASGAVRYKYITTSAADTAGDKRVGAVGLGVNQKFDIRTGAAPDNKFSLSDIGEGTWTIFYVANNGNAASYESASAVDITVTAGPMTVNKTTFKVGEPIMVKADVTAGTLTYKSWYGIVPCDDNGTPKKNFGTMVYRYADGTLDDLRNIKNDTAKTGTFNDEKRKECAEWMKSNDRAIEWGEVSNKHLASLPAGTYWLVYCADSGTIYNGTGVTHSIQIKIEPCIEAKESYAYGEPIMITAYTPADTCYVFIAPKHENINSNYWSIRWQKIEKAGTTTFDMKKSGTTSNYPHLWEIPPGEYSIYMVFAPDSKATAASHASRVNITVCDDSPLAPKSATYSFDKTTGFAGGTLSVTLDESGLENAYNKATHILTYWGDKNGKKLDDYTYISVRKVTGTTTEIDLPKATVIPNEAKTLLVYAYNGAGASETCFEIELPEDRKIYSDVDKGKLLTSFQIVSDIHTQDTQDNYYNKNIAQMFKDIKLTDPNSAGIFVAGDAVNDGREAEYENLFELWENANITTPLFFVSGNHEYKLGDADNSYTSNYKEEKDRYIKHLNKFLEENGEDTIDNGLPYYDLWINGYHYIFLASEAPITHAYLSDKQLDWFEKKLAEDRDINRPTFIIIHQGLMDTVDGCMERDEWDGIIAGDAAYRAWKSSGKWNTFGKYEDKFREILKKYPEAMMFSGHSHRDMTEFHNYYDPTLEGATLPNYLFNTASVAYLSTGFFDDGSTEATNSKSWHAQTYDLYGETHQKWNASKGYYLRVYENCIEIWGREFSTAQWVPNAMYRIVTGEHVHEGEYPCSDKCICGEAVTPSAEHKFSKWKVISEAAVGKQGVRKRSCSVCGLTQNEKIPAIEKPTEAPTATEPEEKKGGCGSTVGGAAVMLSAMVTLVGISLKKKKQD